METWASARPGKQEVVKASGQKSVNTVTRARVSCP
nr:MAG TPA: hypothetical protein [Caudoviricetes sp.]